MALIQTVKDYILKNGKGFLIDKYIGYTGDDIHIIMSHTLGTGLMRKCINLHGTLSLEGTKVAKEQGLYKRTGFIKRFFFWKHLKRNGARNCRNRNG